MVSGVRVSGVRMRVRVRVARVLAHGGCSSRGRGRGSARVAGESVVGRVRLDPMLPRGRRCRGLLPFPTENQRNRCAFYRAR